MPSKLLIEESIHFNSEENTLEGLLGYADDVVLKAAILFLSPHPHMGGNMDNNVLRYLSQGFNEEGCLTLRFNYHGVGKSDISLPKDTTLFDYWSSLEDEVRYDDLMPDVLSAYAILEKTNVENLPVITIGYSLGAILALKAVLVHQPNLVVIISPPNKKRSLPETESMTTRIACFGGEQDFAYNPVHMKDWLNEVPVETQLISFPQIDHFFRQEEELLLQHVLSAVNTLIPNSKAK